MPSAAPATNLPTTLPTASPTKTPTVSPVTSVPTASPTSSPTTGSPITTAPSLTPPPPPSPPPSPPPHPSPPPPMVTIGSGDANEVAIYYQATPELTCLRVLFNSTVTPSALSVTAVSGPASLSWGMEAYSCDGESCGVDLCGFPVIGTYTLAGEGTLGAEYHMHVSGDSFTITFASLSYTDLVADTAYYNQVVAEYKASVAASAGVASGQVAVTSVYAGSVALDTEVSYSDQDVSAGTDPDAFAATLGNSSLLADVFSNSDALGSHANTADASSIVTTAVTSTPTTTGSISVHVPVIVPEEAGNSSAPVSGDAGGTQRIEDDCADVDGCAAETSPTCYGTCVDVAAPGVGYTCSRCPSTMIGDGQTCVDNLCADNNGGCDLAVTCTMDAEAGVRACGQCPTGTSQVADESLGAGWRCGEADGCAQEPCWSQAGFTQPCADVAAPGIGRVCGECPAGFKPAEGGAGCIDVDECESDGGAPAGGCWVSEEDPAVRTDCINAPGGHSCSACPERFIGTGETGCRERVMCDTNHGNCDLLASCTDNPDTGYADCGSCPAGYSGTGDTACTDTDGCVLEPCFPGVTCADTPAPEEGRTCGSCPEGYRGDGASCEMCDLQLSLDAQMGTVVEGAMKRSSTNQLAGVFSGMSSPECVLTQGVQYLWSGVASDGTAVALDSSTNMRETLTLYLPRGSLAANKVFSMRLSASLKGNPEVAAAAQTSFEVQSQALVALIMGGPVQTGEGLPVELNAAKSYDPDDEPGEMVYTWRCVRLEALESSCRDSSGALLPAYMSTPQLSLELAGSQSGALYQLTCTITKAERSAEASTTVTIVTGEPPVPSIVPLPHKHTANSKLTLGSQVTSLQPDTLALAWSLEPLGDAPAVNLTTAAATALNLPSLVLRADTLMAGAEYMFTLSATDRNGPSQVGLLIRVNSPPHGGAVSISPAEGTMAETPFACDGSGWEDDVEDKPLWYQLRYEVVGGAGGLTMLSQWQPSPTFTTTMTTAGEEALGHLVTVWLYVKDTLDATARAPHNLTVRPKVFESEDEQAQYVDSALDSALQSAANGEDSSGTVMAMASVLGGGGSGNRAAAAATRRRVLEEGGSHSNLTMRWQQAQQREAMMDITSAVSKQLPMTTDTVTRMAQTSALVAGEPAELSRRARGLVTTTVEALVAATGSGDPDAQLDAAGAAAVVESLSGVAAGALGAANQSAEVTAVVEVVRSAGLARAQGLVAGEDPVEAGTELLSMWAQRDDLSSGDARAFSSELITPSGAALTLPPSTGAALGTASESVTIMVVASAVDPHSSSGDVAKRRLQLLGEDGEAQEDAEVVTLTDSTSISLLDGGNNSELQVQALEEALSFTLPLQAARGDPGAGAKCVFWDEAGGGYSSAGCATLPNPTPPGAPAVWRTLNVSGLVALEAAWGLAGSGGLETQCEEEWGAVYPEYRGTDAGLRKYLGEGCQLAESENNVSCWWEWRAQRFRGPGCVWAAELGCLCTHLTDFSGAQQTDQGDLQPPDDLSTYDEDEMMRLNLAEVGQSVVLLSVLAIFMLGAPLMFCMSNWFHNRERMTMLLTIVDPGFSTFHDMDGLWTWSIVEGDKYFGAQGRDGAKQPTAGGTLGSRVLEIAKQEKLRLDNERLGNKPDTAKEGSEDAEASQGDESAFGDQGSLQRKIRRWQKRTSIMSNILSTGTTLDTLDEAPTQPEAPGTADDDLAAVDDLEAVDDLAATGRDLHDTYKPGNESHPPAAGCEAWEKESAFGHSVPEPGAMPDVMPEAMPSYQQATASGVILLDQARVTASLAPPAPQPRVFDSDARALYEAKKVLLDIMDNPTPIVAGGDMASATLEPFLRGRRFRIPVLARKPQDTDRGEDPQQEEFDEGGKQGGPVCESREVMGDVSPTSSTALLSSAHEDEDLGSQQPAPRVSRFSRFMGSWHKDEDLAPRKPAPRASRFSRVASFSRFMGTAKLHKADADDSELIAELAKKKRARTRTAHALFKTMNVNIYRLQLCIPLDYLETLALLELRDDNRRRRVDAASSKSLAVEIEQPCGSAGPVMEGFQPHGGVEPAQPAKVKLGAARLLSSSRLSLASDLGSDDGDGSSNQTRGRMWQKLKRRQRLPVERMLGTALVQAFLGIKALLSHKDLAQQAERGSAAPWQMPNNRRFAWYVSVFKVLIGSIARDGWFQRAHLWNLIFLQRVDGSFEMSHHLAKVLKAGPPSDDLEINPVSAHDAQALCDSIPCRLRAIYGGDVKNQSLQELWSTILVLAQLKEYPYRWTENPNDPEETHVTLRGRSELFIQEQCREHPAIEPLLQALRQEATNIVNQWSEDFGQLMRELYEKRQGKDMKRLVGMKEFWALDSAGKRRQMRAARLRCWRSMKRSGRWVAKAHPLSAICMVGATEPFSRSERILTQTNTYVLMLTVTVWFYYSKAVSCCKDFRAHLECPDTFEVNEPCLGYGFCAELGSSGDMLPEELQPAEFICTAFPSGTYTGTPAPRLPPRSIPGFVRLGALYFVQAG
ncbi:hypothetical protein CYMTET_17771 [Cymbomonas tetramitiformis]|uniref:EGF-like domain-containing protein n=1 Tax=Cymbomonas tetramitiformis TaxID=36881 RepID=A0AAE0L6L2_9CHLO|nr:hypothetical protein CYMTET_17771 [Cymbomonas tetramitiformis]